METLVHPVATEKAIRMIEANNVITFVVDMKATRSKVKEEFKKKFNAKVDKITILINSKGKKKALIKVNKESNALDIASQLGLM